MAKWIWYPGEFEIYHNLQLNARRYERGVYIPCQWQPAPVYSTVFFTKIVETTEPITFTCFATAPGYIRASAVDAKQYDIYPTGSTGKPFALPAGRWHIAIRLIHPTGLPAIFIDAGPLSTDESWKANHGLRYSVKDEERLLPAAACVPAFTKPTDDPQVFPFSYERWDVVSASEVPGGFLYDFGKETFGSVRVEGCDPGEDVLIRYGECRDEALDDRAVFLEHRTGKTDYEMQNYALRYVFVSGGKKTVWLNFEFLPLTDRASFDCDVPEVRKVFDVCSHTFHLNSRECFYDGVKRDRWVWSGDAFQCYFVNNYLFFDKELTKRTIRALLGKPPYEQHINNINDYTMYLFIAVGDYYEATGDKAFVREIWPRLSALFAFTHSRLDEKGLVSERPEDWVFIDWANIDKDGGPQCTEQILLWKVMSVMDRLSAVLSETSPVAPGEADALRRLIFDLYWDEQKGGFINSYTSGKRQVTRHPNIFAVLYDFAPEKTETIVENVLRSDAVDPITTPYFKFFELSALCHTGSVETMQDMIMNYWYPMLELGATSIWEQFDPRKTGAEHYEMYGDPYGCSMCHAWGSGPIYLLGRYVAGVASTSVGYGTFTVAPQPGRYHAFTATVPLPEEDGSVTVVYDEASRTVTATATRGGGTLRFAGQEKTIPAGGEAVVRW